MISTSGLTTTSTAPTNPARAGVKLANARIQPGISVWRCRVSHRSTPNTISADPRTTRSQDAQAGDVVLKPPSAPEAATKTAVTTAKPNSQPPRKARLLGRGCGECTTSTAGITDNGESAMTNASGTSPVSTETQ